MGDDTPIVVAREGRVELPIGSFENVLHQITQTGKNVEFTSDLVSVLDMHSNSITTIGEVDHKSRL
jgi:hypothetical protein